MGAGQSNLYLYLGKKSGGFELEGHYKVSIKKSFFKVCKNFVRYEYEITYNEPLNEAHIKYYRFYRVSIYTGTDYYDLGELVFTYYCNHFKKILKKVVVYYSLLYPKDPLIITFVTHTHDRYACTYKTLKEIRWSYASFIYEHTIKLHLDEQLVEEFKGVSKSLKVRFSAFSEKSKFCSSEFLDVGDGKNYKAVIYRPKSSGCTLYNKDLFSLLNSNGVKNFIDPFYLSDVTGKDFDGIAIYYTATSSISTVLLVEFLSDCKTKTQFVRNDKNSTWWVKKEIKFDDDESLSKELSNIKEYSDKNVFITYILDSKKNYNDVKLTEHKKNVHYSYYTHNNNEVHSVKSSILLCKNTQINLEKNSFIKHFINVSAYFLKIKDQKDEDDTPFLIKILQHKSILFTFTDLARYFHPQKNDDSFKLEWKKFKYTEKDLEVKLKEIGELLLKKEKEKAKELEKTDFKELRNEAIGILEKPPPEPPPKTKPPPAKADIPPKPTQEKTVPEKKEEEPPLSAPAIAGIAVGGLIGTAAVGGSGYGLYLYFTTIYLLT